MTREDVPPRSLGGSKLVLTCRRCNSEAGRKLDWHARAEEDVRQFVVDGNYRRLPGILADLNANVELSRKDDVNLIRYLPRNNPPTRLNELMEATSHWRDGTDIRLQVGRPYVPRRAMISWLKTGYLLAFAWLGYRYILRDVLDKVRAQIKDPEVRHIEDFCTFQLSSNTRRIGVIREPTYARGIVVTAQRHIVLLPLFDEEYDFYRRIFDLGRKGLYVQGRSFSWPERAIYRLDHATPEEVTVFSSLSW